ncbi:hypothetical protein [Nocardioides sp.]|uniref:hypothetical protein n=1 Tax=Nocardioides sp. TaxID=35761 RepID=UPI002D7F349A|nr:hypothetical protein [Nocardioides sp.]HET8961772.1 hypothetical protein [Nocardioides sp.]
MTRIEPTAVSSAEISRRRLLAGAGAAAATGVLGGLVPATAHAAPGLRQDPPHTYLSTSGVPHADIGDVATLRAGLGWDPGDPNSFNQEWYDAMQVVFAQIASENPEAVLHQGDMVEGRWGNDNNTRWPNTGIFGPVGTPEERTLAVQAAADCYYSEWLRFRDASGVTTNWHFGVGDHEIGDSGRNGIALGWQYGAMETFKSKWSEYFTRRPDGGHKYTLRPVGTAWEDTAYAVRLDPLTLLVTVDPFVKRPDGIRSSVEGDQLDWLDELLASQREDGIKHILVQSESPAFGPNRAANTSQITMEGGAGSPFWRVLQKHRVDLLLCAEFHEITAHHDPVTQATPFQIVHGGNIFSSRSMNYLLIRTFPTRIELEAKRMAPATNLSPGALLWNTNRSTAERIAMKPGASPVGTLTINKIGPRPTLENRTGVFTEYVA